MSDHAHAHGNEHDDHDHGGSGKYLMVFLALCVLTGASFFTCSSYWPFKDTPSIGWAFMLAVSCTKAMLVILFFMHLLWEARWKYVLTIPAGMMSIYLMLMLVPDVGLRMRKYSEERKVFAAEAVVHEHAEGEHHEGDGHAGDAHDDSHGDSHAGDDHAEEGGH
ncbi:MAG: cytochrome C oxidase subunit IV family protein [Planctomycetota bacterium]